VARVRVLDEAVIEATEAAAWYENARSGLGSEFAQAILAALDLLEEEVVPLTTMPGKAGQEGARRLRLNRFPYDVVVRAQSTEIIVVAIAHHSRRPGYWQSRLSG